MTAAVDLPGLLGASNCPDASGEVAPGRPEDPAWQQAAALRAQLGLKQQPELGGKHLMCVFTLLQTSAGLQLAQLLRVQAACAALDKRKVRLLPLHGSGLDQEWSCCVRRLSAEICQ